MTENESQTNEEDTQKVDWEKIAKYKAAELDNYIKRQKDAVGNAFNDGRTHAITSILPVLDSISDAVKIVKDENDLAGIKILERKFAGILAGMGLEEIVTKKGDPFDPYIHTCVAAGENTENLVLEVWQKGYKFAGRVIRPVTVKI